MELEQLRAFVAVAEEKSYTKAGERLYMSHSTMSRAVSALEHEFGYITKNSHEISAKRRHLPLDIKGEFWYPIRAPVRC